MAVRMPYLWVFAAMAFACGCATRKAADRPGTDTLPEKELAKIETARFIDNRPYEFTWHDPREEHDPLVDFGGLEGWKVVAPRGLKAKIERTYEKQLWGKFTGMFQCERAEDERRFMIRPPSPIVIPEDFDSVSLWIYRPPEDAASSSTSRVDIALRDSRGMERVIPLAALDWPQGWFLAQCNLDGDVLKGLRFPYEFAGLAVTCGGGRDSLQIYFDSLSFFLASRRPVVMPDAGLPFAGDASVLPRTDSTGIVHETGLAAPGVYRFVCRDRAFRAEYRFDAAQGLEGISLWRRDREVGRLMQGASVQGFPASNHLRVLRQEGSAVYAEYDGGLSLRLGLTNHSLTVDVRCPGGRAEGLSLGHLDGFARVDLLQIPFLSLGLSMPPSVAMITGGRGSRYFLSIWPDWHRSAASGLTPPDEETDSLMGGVLYAHKSDGRRNDLSERIIITVSDRFEDVLPEVPHAPAAKMDPLASRILMRVPGETDYKEVERYLQALCRHGMTNLVMSTDRAIWTDGWGSAGLRSKANPHRGGDEVLKKYARTVRDSGAAFGLYAHCTSLSPLNRNWSSGDVCLDPSGGWMRMDASSYVLKPSSVPTACAVLRDAVSNYAPQAVIADGIADAPPWMRTDFDARAAGAGKFITSYSALAGFLRGIPAPVIAPDETSPLYAGFADAFITGDRAWNRAAGDSFFPVFKLLKLQSLSLWYGPALSLYEEDSPDDRLIDEQMAAWLAYGQLGEIPFGWKDPSRMARIYHMLSALQPFYAGKTPQFIAWWDGRRMVSVSEAIARGVQESSQMYFQYPGGFEMWVNGALRKNWNVKTAGREWVLPPSGWLAVGPDFLAASSMEDGKRLDFIRSPGFVFYDGRGRKSAHEGCLSAANIMVRRAEAPNRPLAVEVFDTSGGRETGISAEWLNNIGQVECRVAN